MRDPRDVPLIAGALDGPAEVNLLAIEASTGRQIGEITLGSVTIQGGPRVFDLPSPQHRTDVDFGGQIRLLGFDLRPDALTLDQELDLVLYWQAVATPARDFTVFTHLLDSANTVVGQKDNQPLSGKYSTSGWLPGEVVKDSYKLKLTKPPSSKTLSLEIGLYDAASGQRLKISASGADHVILSEVKVKD